MGGSGLPAGGASSRAPRRGLRPRRPRRALRAVAGIDDEGRQPRRSARRGPQLPQPGGRRTHHAEGCARDRSRGDHGRRLRGDPCRARPSREDLRLPGPAASAPAPTAGARVARGPPLEGRGVLLPAGRGHGPAPRDVPRRPSLDRRGRRPGGPASVPRGLGRRRHPAALRRVPAGPRGGVPHPFGGAPRPGERAHDRAAGGLGRVRDAPGGDGRHADLEGPALEGRAGRGPASARPSGSSSSSSTGRRTGIRTSTRTIDSRLSSSTDLGPRTARRAGSSTTRRSSAGRSWSCTRAART